jgi:aarF domain-containing kinase
MRQDLRDLFVIVDWVAYFEPQYNFLPVLDEWSKVAERELDFNNETANSERVRQDMAAAGLDVVVPKIHADYSSERVIVMDFAKGFKVTDQDMLDAHNVDREALLRRICQAFAYQLYVNGFFNCDPHPGNILVQVENGIARPVLLDYGMCRELQDDKRLAFAQMIYSASIMDFGSLLGSFDKMGLKLKRLDPTEDMKNIRFVLRDTAPGTEMRKVGFVSCRRRWKTLPRAHRFRPLFFRFTLDLNTQHQSSNSSSTWHNVAIGIQKVPG